MLTGTDVRDKLISHSPTAVIKIAGVEVPCILDTGAETSLIPYSFYQKYLANRVAPLGDASAFINLVGANDLSIPIVGYFETNVTVYGQTLRGSFLVKQDNNTTPRDGRRVSHPVILGCNVLRNIMYCVRDKVSMDNVSSDWNLVFQSLEMTGRETPPEPPQPSVSGQVVIELCSGREFMHLPPFTAQRVSCCCDSIGNQCMGKSIFIQPIESNPHCSDTEETARSDRNFDVWEGLSIIDGQTVQIIVANYTSETLRIAPHSRLAKATVIESTDQVFLRPSSAGMEVQVREVIDIDGPVASDEDPVYIGVKGEGNSTNCRSEREVFMFPDQSTYSLPPGVSLSSMPIDEAAKVAALIQRYEEAFSMSDFELGSCDLIPHKIVLTDDRPINLPYRRVPPHQVAEVKQLLQSMLDKGIIRRSTSPYASPVVLVRKKNGTLRLCIDYRLLNAKTVRDAFPLPRIDETLEALGGAKYFSSLDLAHGYYQVTMDTNSISKTAFRVPWGLFEFTRMPQGLVNSPSTFERIMELIFGDMNLTDIVLYLDDILVFSSSFEGHLQRLEKVFQRLIANGLKLNGKKCPLFEEQVAHLGHIVSSAGVAVDPGKVERIQNWPIPETSEQLRSFLGLASYYRRYVPNFSKIAAPLNALVVSTPTKAGKPPSNKSLGWLDEADNAFRTLKKLLSEAPVLVYPNFDREFVVEVDASLRGLGACLSQYDDDGQLHPIAYASRALRGPERNYPDYSSFKLELLALKWAVAEKFKGYLMGSRFVVYTDHNPLAHLKTAKLGATEHRWVAQLAPFDMEVQYRSGRSNRCADALSRCPGNLTQTQVEAVVAEVTCCNEVPDGCQKQAEKLSPIMVSSSPSQAITPNVLPSYTHEQLAELQLVDKELGFVWKMWRKRWQPGHETPTDPTISGWLREWSRITEKHGVLYRVVQDPVLGEVKQFLVPHNLRDVVLRAVHDDWGHQGISRTLSLLKTRCFWPGLAQDVQSHIKECFKCVTAKAPTPVVKAPMRHLLALRPLELLAIDFLKLDQGKGGIEDVLVMTDAFTKYAQAIPCKDQSAKVVAKTLQDRWFAQYGVPLRIHSDRGRNFESNLVKEVCALYGIQKSRTTAYHPQGNGQTERFNRTLCGLIKSLDSSRRKDWPELLPHLVSMYNSTPHRSTGLSPYLLLFGREPVLPVDQLLSNTDRRWDEDYVQSQARLIKKASQLATARMQASIDRDKRRYDRRAKAEPLEVGDRVLMKQCAFTARHKLENHYRDEQFVIVKRNSEQDVYTVRPALGGPESTVNRKLLVIDPRGKEPFDKPTVWLENSGPESNSSHDSSDEEEGLPLWWKLEVNNPPMPVPVPNAEGNPKPVAAPRRSQRLTKGKHGNPAHWPAPAQ